MTESRDKRIRQAMIREVIQTQLVETQEELSDMLAARGIPVTQATISRDIKEMGLIKAPHQDSHRYALPEDAALTGTRERLQRILGELLVAVFAAENLIVVKTVSAGADVVSEAIDGLQWPEVLGTIAGDNTVLAVVRSKDETEAIKTRLERLL